MKQEIRSMWDDLYDHEAQGKLLAQLKDEVRFDRIAKSILIALSNESSGLTKIELLGRVRSRRQRFLSTLKSLVELERVFKSKGGKRNQPFRYKLTKWN